MATCAASPSASAVLASGSVPMDATSLGLYWTHVGPGGWYLDSVLMHSWLDGEPRSNRGVGIDLEGHATTASWRAATRSGSPTRSRSSRRRRSSGSMSRSIRRRTASPRSSSMPTMPGPDGSGRACRAPSRTARPRGGRISRSICGTASMPPTGRSSLRWSLPASFGATSLEVGARRGGDAVGDDQPVRRRRLHDQSQWTAPRDHRRQSRHPRLHGEGWS